MVSVFLLLVTIGSAYLVVLAGAAAYELTGVDRATAHFQALSAFTGTGFTTRASERIVNHPLRRRITIVLILLGYAGGATVIASLVTSVNTESLGLSVRNLAVLAVAGLAMVWLLGRLGPRHLGDLLRRALAAYMHEEVSHEDLLTYRAGFGISRVEVPRGSVARGRPLSDLALDQHRLKVLAVETSREVHPVPDPSWVVEEGQFIVVYGDLRSIEGVFSAPT